MEFGYLCSMPSYVLLDNHLTPTEKILFATLCGLASRTGVCDVSNNYLATLLRYNDGETIKQLSDVALVKMLGHLEDKGHISYAQGGDEKTVIIVHYQQKAIEVKIKQARPVRVALTPTGDKKELADRVLAYLSQASKTRGYRKQDFKPVKANLDPVVARINDGYGYDDFVKVINIKFEDEFFQKNTKYLTPETLFRPAKFEKYLMEAESIKGIENKVVTKLGLANSAPIEAEANVEGVKF